MEMSGQLYVAVSDRKLGGAQNLRGRCGEEKNLILPGIESRLCGPSLYMTVSAPRELPI
jgi:hypothetical protein